MNRKAKQTKMISHEDAETQRIETRQQTNTIRSLAKTPRRRGNAESKTEKEPGSLAKTLSRKGGK
jgi:hypothetical protein